MKMIRTLANIILFPIRLLILLAQMVLGAVIGLSAWIFNLVAGVLLFCDIIGKIMGLDTQTFIFLLVLSITIYLLPVISKMIISTLSSINVKLKF